MQTVPCSYDVRPATGGDLDFLYGVVRATIRPYVEVAWGTWDEAWQQSRFTRNFDAERWQVILVGTVPVGGYAVEYRGAELYLANLHVLPDYQGAGIGTAIVCSLLEEASLRNLSVTLTVLRPNPGARRLYERLGFRLSGEEAQKFWMVSGPLP